MSLRRALVVVACAVTALVVFTSSASAVGPVLSGGRGGSCHLSNGIKHVIVVQFDNTHLFRDNRNVPSDLQQMPHLKNFLQSQGTLMSNDHTILISHTAGGITTTLTGLYPDRGGQTVSNSYGYFHADGSTGFASSFTYWNDPVSSTNPLPNMVNGDSGTPSITPAPWVPYTRAGCDFGGVGTANIELENTGTGPSGDMTTVFGSGSPEWNEAKANSTKASADFVGIAIHCAQRGPSCASSPNAKPDPLPGEPGGYNGFSALFGAKYVNPAITGGQSVVNDLAGNPINDPAGNPGFPGFDSMTPAVSLGYVAQMQEAGVPVTYAYLSDAHDNHTLHRASGPGEADYVQQLQSYDQAFGTFFNRLAGDGLNAGNTLFLFTVDEGDHFVGKQVQGCNGVSVPCTYTHAFCNASVIPATCPSNQIGEVSANLNSLLPAEPQFDIHFDSAPTIYVKGHPGPTDPAVRQFERDAAAARAVDPYVNPNATTPITRYLADPVAEQALHMVNADPNRTPTFTLFGNPDYFFETFTPACGANVCVDPSFAWNHGDNAPEIARTWIGMVGPGVRNKGLDSTTWSDHTDVRPTLLALLGLKDDYTNDGRVLLQDVSSSALPSTLNAHRGTLIQLGSVYKQLEAPFNRFGQDMLKASTRALASGSSTDDTQYTDIEQQISDLTAQRNSVGSQMRAMLSAAAFDHQPIDPSQAQDLIAAAEDVLFAADVLAQ